MLGLTSFTLGAAAYRWLYTTSLDLLEEVSEEDGHVILEEAVRGLAQLAAVKRVPSLSVEAATEFLEAGSGFSVTPKAVGHTTQLGSNVPCEDVWSSGAFTFFEDKTKDWVEWAIFDGHAGPRTAEFLKEHLPSVVGQMLWETKCMDRPYVPNDGYTVTTIQKAFEGMDKSIVDSASKTLQAGGPLTDLVAESAAAFSGSCALLALYDPVRSILRVANTGDSRAVLGRWDHASNRYIAMPMSVDQTGFNEAEVERIRREHPDEDVVDPKTGRVHGIAVSRAFGDSRWKWTEDLVQLAYEKIWGPKPRPNGVIKTPPYLTAQPEVMETKVQTGERPDFLIMASDGLWDNMSSEDAVTCVQMWLDKHKPTNFLEEQIKKAPSWNEWLTLGAPAPSKLPTFSSASDLAGDDDTYFDEEEGAMKWRVSPKHFVVEDEHCGVHLVKNALGGKRRDLFTGVMTVQAPLSRNVRDDITVHVIFFGVDTQEQIKWQ